MISITDIDRTIEELLNQSASYSVCEKLACLYTVRDHIQTGAPENHTICKCEGSELAEVISGKDIHAVLGILNEHLCAVKCLYPKEYEEVIFRLKNV